MEFKAARCPNCSGEIMLDPKKETGFCVHCGSKIFFKKAIKTLKVDGIVTLESLLKLAREAMDYGNYKEAYAYYSKCYELDPANLEVIVERTISVGYKNNIDRLFYCLDRNLIYDNCYVPTDFWRDKIMISDEVVVFLLGLNNTIKHLPAETSNVIRVKASEQYNNFAIALFHRILSGNSFSVMKVRDIETLLLFTIMLILYILEIASKCNPSCPLIINNIITVCDIYVNRITEKRFSESSNEAFISGIIADTYWKLERKVPNFKVIGFNIESYIPSDLLERTRLRKNNLALINVEDVNINIDILNGKEMLIVKRLSIAKGDHTKKK